jgi:hypothetical protein
MRGFLAELVDGRVEAGRELLRTIRRRRAALSAPASRSDSSITTSRAMAAFASLPVNAGHVSRASIGALIRSRRHYCVRVSDGITASASPMANR